MRLLAISGSLDPSSANSALLDAVASQGEIEVDTWDELADVPPFRPDADGDEHVASLRRAVGGANAVLIATPEYAGGMPGVLKNALDWLVGSGELYGKKLVVVSAAPSEGRGANARRWVEEVARMQGAVVVDSFTVPLPRTSPAEAIRDAASEVLRRMLGALDRSSEGQGSRAGPR